MMIDPSWMALALLGLSWVTALMVALDAAIDVRAWLRRRREWASGLVEGVAGRGLGALEIEQRARVFESGAIGFFERAHRSTVGGEVELSGERLTVAPAAGAQVWLEREALERAAQCPSPHAFAELLAQAKGPQALRTVRVEVPPGARVFLVGARDASQFVASLVATTDPRRELRQRLVLNAGLIALNLGWVSLGTALALSGPAFGSLSIVGACVLLGHFLGITPLAVEVRERSKTPAERALLGSWAPPALRTSDAWSSSSPR